GTDRGAEGEVVIIHAAPAQRFQRLRHALVADLALRHEETVVHHRADTFVCEPEALADLKQDVPTHELLEGVRGRMLVAAPRTEKHGEVKFTADYRGHLRQAPGVCTHALD